MLGFSPLSTVVVGYVIVCIQLASPGSSLTTDIMSMARDSPLVCRELEIADQEIILIFSPGITTSSALRNLPIVHVCMYCC